MYQNSLDRIKSIGEVIADSVSKSIFPVETNDRILDIEKIDKLSMSDIYDNSFNINKHLDAKLKGRDLTVPLKATLVLKDKKTNKVIDRKKVTLIDQPIMTNRGSFIYGGNDYHMVNQLRLKPGVYTRTKENGEIESFFNLSKGGASGFSMWMDPESSKINFKIGGKNPSMYALMKALDVSDTELESKWGKELLDLNKLTDRKLDNDIAKIYTSLYRSKAEAGADINTMKAGIKEFFDNTGISPETTKLTLGKEFDRVTPELLLRTSDKLIKVSRNEAEPDERDALEFKNVYSVEDLISARINAKAREAQFKIKNNLNTKDSISDIYSKEILNKPVRSFMTQSSLSTSSDQTNPVAMVNAMTRVTPMGEGGLSSLDIVTTSMRAVSDSHVGALDPTQTPESKRIGINLNLTDSAEVRDKEIHVTLIDFKTGKEVKKTKVETHDKYVAFPDQYDKKLKKFNYPKVRAIYKGKTVETEPDNIDYLVRDSSDMFSVGTNLIPFVADVQGNRTMLANKMSGQAISLLNREAPLVQVKLDTPFKTNDGFSVDTEEKAAARIFSLKSPENGVVSKVEKDFIEIKPDDGGKAIKIYKYDHFPLANKSYMHAEFIVKAGDKVRQGQILAEDNFTKDNTLALGTNLNVAYLPFRDKTFEDGIVVSESAAKKLTSQHLHVFKTSYGDKDKLGTSSYMQQFPMQLNSEQQSKLDSRGVIKQGETVYEGDLLIALLKYREPTETDVALGKLSKTLLTKFGDGGVKYDHSSPGIVERVTDFGGEITVHVSTDKVAEEGDKLVGRYGNKGIITAILPDDEMPVTANGDKADMIMSPYGVPGRINVGQIYETIAGKAAQKRGRPIKITNMDPNIKSDEALEALAKEYGVTTQDAVFDPKTGRKLADTSFGPQYVYKLTHMVDQKMSARSPYSAYNTDEQPAKGGGTSARSLDRLTWYALLAHGARENLAEMATYKSNKNPEFWNKIRLGLPVPAPQTAFATDKLFSLMQAAGVNVKKEGQMMRLTPMTDAEILEKSNGEIDDAQVMMAKTLRPIKDGLFDDSKTGGLNGKKWTHIKLHEPVVSPMMAPAAQTLIGLTDKKFNSVVAGDLFLDPVSLEFSENKTDKSLTGGRAIQHALAQIDPETELSKLRTEALSLTGDKLDKANKKMRYLKALSDNNLTPDKAYIINNVPVLPPHMRPIYSLPDGSLSTSPINFLYRDLIMVNKELKASEGLPEFARKALRKDLYNATKAAQGIGDPIIARGEKKVIGALETIKGEQPKTGFFQSVVFSKKQELTGQSTAAPSVDVSPDEVMLPKAMGWNLFEPFIHKELTNMGFSNMQAKQMIQEQDPKAEAAMHRVAENRPVWINRAPSLHKLSMLAMYPKIHDGSAIKVNPLVIGGYNMDFDGDSIGVYVPASQKAVEEAKQFTPSKILDDPRDYGTTLLPSHDIQLGIFALSAKGNRRLDKNFGSMKEAENAFLRNDINLSDVVKINGYETTFGREKLRETLPKGVAIPEAGVNKSMIDSFFKSIADADSENVNKRFADVTRVAAEYNASSGIGLTLNDLKSDPSFMKPFKDKLKNNFANLKTNTEKTKMLSDLVNDFGKETKRWISNNVWKNNLATMSAAAGKPGADQVKQLKFAPLAVTDEEGKLVPIPVTRSYSQGITSSDFWVTASGARKGMIDRALQTAEPGYYTKQLIATTLDQVVSDLDCGTKNGIELDLESDKMDILWRYDMQNNLIDNARYEALLRSGAKSIKVRSPITCEANEGICQKCYGTKPNGNPVEIGTNVGVEAGHVATERTTQLTMKSFHTGSVASEGPSLASGFTRLQQLSHFPNYIQNRATLAKIDGLVTDIKTNPAGGMNVWVGDERHYCPVSQLKVKIGDKVSKGEPLSEGAIKPQELLATKGIRATQDYLIDAMQDTFSNQGIDLNRRAFETIVRATTNVTKVTDPGKNEDFLPGDKVQLTKVLAYNRMNPGKPISHEPELLGIDFSSKITEDWAAKLNTNRLKTVIQEGVAKGDVSSVHSYNPVTPYIIGKEFGKGEKGKY